MCVTTRKKPPGWRRIISTGHGRGWSMPPCRIANAMTPRNLPIPAATLRWDSPWLWCWRRWQAPPRHRALLARAGAYGHSRLVCEGARWRHDDGSGAVLMAPLSVLHCCAMRISARIMMLPPPNCAPATSSPERSLACSGHKTARGCFPRPLSLSAGSRTSQKPQSSR